MSLEENYQISSGSANEVGRIAGKWDQTTKSHFAKLDGELSVGLLGGPLKYNPHS